MDNPYLGFRLSMMGIVLITLCLLGAGLQFSTAVADELSSELIHSIANETNHAELSQGEFEFLFFNDSNFAFFY